MGKKSELKKCLSAFLACLMIILMVPENIQAVENDMEDVSGGNDISVNDISSGDISGDDISSGDISGGDVSSGDSGEKEEPEEDFIVEGRYGKIQWNINTDGHLTAWGNGEAVYIEGMDKVNGPRVPLWYDYKKYIITADINITGASRTSRMFEDCVNLKSVDLTDFDASGVNEVSSMFKGCTALETVIFGEAEYNNGLSLDSLFCGCAKLKSIDLSMVKLNNVKSLNQAFENCTSLEYLNLSGMELASDIDSCELETLFLSCTGLKELTTFKNIRWNIRLPKTMYDKEGNAYSFCPKETDSVTLYSEEMVSLDDEKIRVLEIPSFEYTGTAIKPDVVVYDGNYKLKKGTDYTVSYKNNIKAAGESDAKPPTVTIQGKGSYSGKLVKKFTITKRKLNNKDFNISFSKDVTENGKVQKPLPVVKFMGKKLKLNVDYTVSYPDNGEGAYKDAGSSYRVTVCGINNFEGELTTSFYLYEKGFKKVNIASIKKDFVSSYSYTGEKVNPKLVLKHNNEELVQDRDYQMILLGDAVRPGKYPVLVEGMNQYTGSFILNFTITGTPISKAEIDITEPLTYNGKFQVPYLQLTYDGKVLEKYVDYNIRCEKNKDAGTATIYIESMGGFAGTVKKTVKILPYDMELDESRLISGKSENITVTYEKGGVKPELNLTFDGKKLAAGKDYTITYKNNTKITLPDDIRKPEMVIKGKGNFQGSFTVPFTIIPKDLASVENPVTIKVADVVASDKPGKFVSIPSLYDSNGKKLAAGTDYNKNIVYMRSDRTVLDIKKDKVAAGEDIIVRVTGTGGYTGSLEGTYHVAKASFKNAKVTVKDKLYSNKAVFLTNEDVTVTLNGEKLVWGKDFVVVSDSYKNNHKTGNASVIFRGIGNYSGDKKVNFKIIKKYIDTADGWPKKEETPKKPKPGYKMTEEECLEKYVEHNFKHRIVGETPPCYYMAPGAVPSSCVSDLLYIPVCVRCGYESAARKSPATGHAYDLVKSKEVTPVTCTEDGLIKETWKCIQCGDSYIQDNIIRHTGHKYGEDEITVTYGPAESPEWYSVYCIKYIHYKSICSVCGDVWEDTQEKIITADDPEFRQF